MLKKQFRARISKRLWSQGIDSEQSILPAYVAWRAGTANTVELSTCRTDPAGLESISGILKRFTNTGSGKRAIMYTSVKIKMCNCGVGFIRVQYIGGNRDMQLRFRLFKTCFSLFIAKKQFMMAAVVHLTE